MAAKLMELLATVLDLPESAITDDLAMKDTEVWDSLKHMELVMSIEQTFGIQLSFAEIVQMQNVYEIKRVLQAKGKV